MLLLIERLVCSARVHADRTIRVFISIAELKRMRSVFNASCCDQKMSASHFLGPLDHFVSVLHMVFGAAELFVSQVGSDVEKRASFVDVFAELLHGDVNLMVGFRT